MDIMEVQDLINSPRPTPEEHVDIECSSCAGQWASTAGTDCYAPREGVYTVIFKNYVGEANLNEGSFSCPNGCMDHGVPRTLHSIVAAGNPTPTDRWEYAQLRYKRQQLTAELNDIENLLENYEGMYF